MKKKPSELDRLKSRILIVICCLLPIAVSANPYILEPSSLFTFAYVAFWALVVEAGLVALLLTFRGVQVLRLFIGYFLLNSAVFLFVFRPFLDRDWPLVLLEILVVCVDGLLLKILVHFDAMQGDSYRGVSWFHALLVSLSGNAASFFVGLIASRKPWEVH